MTFSLSTLSLALLLPQDAPPAGGGSSLLIPFAIIFAIFWFIVIGPERKKAKQREALLAGIKKGDRVLMTSGMFGEVREIRDGILHLQIADGVRVKFSAAAVQDLVDASGKSLTTPELPSKSAESDSADEDSAEEESS